MKRQHDPMALTEREWAAAERLARDLARDVDRNELGKVLSYFQRVGSKEKLFRLLKRLPGSGYIRSGQTRGYLQRIAEACERHLQGIEEDEQALRVLGWAFRLTTYYQTRRGTRYARGRTRRR